MTSAPNKACPSCARMNLPHRPMCVCGYQFPVIATSNNFARSAWQLVAFAVLFFIGAGFAVYGYWQKVATAYGFDPVMSNFLLYAGIVAIVVAIVGTIASVGK